MALITLEELVAYIQQDVPAATGQLAIEGASDMVTSYCRQSFAVSTDTKLLPTSTGGYVVKLPQGPVTDVATVLNSRGQTLALTEDYYWNGVSAEIRLTRPDDVVTVTYTHGLDSVPAAVKLVCLSIASRTYANPTSLRTEFIADYQATNFSGAIDITKAEKAVLDRYRANVYSNIVPR